MTGSAVHGGLQILAYPMKAARYKARTAKRRRVVYSMTPECRAMGLAPGGRMKQEIYRDTEEFDVWDQRHSSRCFVSLLNSKQWMAVTGERPPSEPPTAQDYTAHGLPWFDYHAGNAQAVAGSDKLRGLASIAQHAKTAGQETLADNESIKVSHAVALGESRQVWEGVSDGRA